MCRIPLFLSFLFLAKLPAMEVLTEAKAAYFCPTDSTFRSIYSGGGLYSLEASVQLGCTDFYPWASVGYFYQSGHSLVQCALASHQTSSTHLTLVPIGLGLKYILSEDLLCFRPYIGLGALLTYAHIHNDYPYVAQRQTQWGLGGIAKGGVLIPITGFLLVDLFVDYSYLEICFKDHFENVTNHRVHLSGFSFGGGIGYLF